MAKVFKEGKKRMDWHEALQELVATLADAWECADLHERLDSWWYVVTGKTNIG